ncbi:MAG: NAD(P)-dependent oxidoreductase [Magnetococcales bacterium]|nr:NAD(P)-dependent oxidoreductase [Magnetococcales bacterium]
MSSCNPLDLAFIGLGTMGFSMAGHLAAAGHRLTVWNRSAAKARAWVEGHGGALASTPAQAARGAALVFCCVGNDAHLRQVCLGAEGLLAALEPGAILVDHTTASAQIARELEGLARDRGCGFLDAPVSGGQAGAQGGTLAVMVGGAKESFDRAAPVMAHYARSVTHMGHAGAGQLTKMVNQICIAGLVQGLAEGLHFARAAGLDGPRVLAAIGAGAAGSWQMANRGATMWDGRFDFGFAVDWMRKDLDLCLAEARHNGARLPVAALVDQFYAQVQARGGGRWDTSSLIALLDQTLMDGGGLPPPSTE